MDGSASFGYWLRRQRMALGLTQAELAARVGCALGTIRKLESDARRPSPSMAARLAQILAVPPQEQDHFFRVARAELSPQQLAVPTQPIAEAAGPASRDPLSLPTLRTPLIGRAHEVAAVSTLLESGMARLVTLVGPPGIGKTRLALQIGAELRDTFPDGVFVVSLAAITDPDLIVPAIARALEIAEGGDESLLQRLGHYLASRRLLLILDNLEHLASNATVVSELLMAVPGLKVLATSRVPLHLYGEHEYAVPPLALPDVERLPPLDSLATIESVRLFVERARAARSDFALGEQNAASVAAICMRLDGLPLAIELAAARIKLFAPQALLAQLDHSLDILTGGARDLPPRQRAVRSAITWSYELLSEREQALFRWLGVFAGGWTIEAAEAICGNNLEFSVLDGLQSLVDQNLIKHIISSDGESRFGMLETIREFAREQLVSSGEEADVAGRHAAYYLALAETAARHFERADEATWLRQLDREQDNLRSALDWLLTDEPVAALRLASACAWFYESRGSYSQGHRWLADALRNATMAPPDVLAKALLRAALLAWRQGEDEDGQALAESSRVLFEQIGNRLGVAWCINAMGLLASSRQEHEQAWALWEQSLALARGLGNTWGARSLTAILLINLAGYAFQQGDYHRARNLGLEALAIAEAVGNQRWRAYALSGLSGLAFIGGNFEDAWAYFSEYHALLTERGEQRLIAQYVESLAIELATDERRPDATEGALRLFGAAEALREAINAPISRNDEPLYHATLNAMRAQMDAPQVARVWAEGCAMTVEQAVARALGVPLPQAKQRP